ncbi:MAG: hypothetical protein K6G83_01905 [Lachnospiraceae bacterium]|nr:hypothetical protein [Lachnospiraceae bacterium]
MDQFVASLAKACLTMGDLSTLYLDNVPSDFQVPSLYFPPCESNPSASAFNCYRTDYFIYAKVFAVTRQDAMKIAEAVVQGIMQARCMLPVYKEDGKESGDILKIKPPSARVIDEGVAQINLAYTIVRGFKEEPQPGASEVKINKDYS